MLDYIYSCQAFAQVELGISVEDFDSLTPALFDKYVEVWEAKQLREEYFMSVVPTILYNINRGKSAPKNYWDFMPRFGKKVKNQQAATTFEEFEKQVNG